MQRKVVVLPQPLAPSSTEIAPDRNVAESESITVAVPNRFVTFSRVTVMAGEGRHPIPVATCQNSINVF